MHACQPNNSHHLHTQLTRTRIPCESTWTYPLCRLPVNIIARELREVAKFELQRRHIGRADEPSVFLGRNSFAPAEVYHRKREPRWGIERRNDAVRKIARARQVEGVAPGVVIRRKKAAKHTHRSLHARTKSGRTTQVHIQITQRRKKKNQTKRRTS